MLARIVRFCILIIKAPEPHPLPPRTPRGFSRLARSLSGDLFVISFPQRSFAYTGISVFSKTRYLKLKDTTALAAVVP